MNSWARSHGVARMQPAPASRPRATSRNPTTSRAPAVKCADGFDGDIVWNSGTPTGSCAPAECGISNTTGKGLDCKCAYKFVGRNHVGRCRSSWSMCSSPLQIPEFQWEAWTRVCLCLWVQRNEAGSSNTSWLISSWGLIWSLCSNPLRGWEVKSSRWSGLPLRWRLQWNSSTWYQKTCFGQVQQVLEQNCSSSISSVQSRLLCACQVCSGEHDRRWQGVRLQGWLSGQCHMDRAQCGWNLQTCTLLYRELQRETWLGVQVLGWIWWQYLDWCWEPFLVKCWV